LGEEIFMGYPESMRESVKRLEVSRKRRMEQEIPLMTLQEKSHLLESYHPDYRPGARREISIGVNKDDRAPNEFVDLLECRSFVDPDTFKLDSVYASVDVLIIGGGGGGATAALFAQEAGAKVLLATKLRFGDSNTIMAEGGINACTSKGDTPVRHYIDTMGGGGFKNIPALVRALVVDSPKIIKWLEEMGVPFDRQPDGNFMQRHLAGGHSRPRGHSVGDYTGMVIVQVLRDEVLNKRIEVMEFSPAVELLLDDRGRCAGAILMDLDTNRFQIVQAKTTILATGGIGRLHIQNFPTTNHYGATADGLVIAYREGAKLVYMDSIQFHPTGTAYPTQLMGLLVTEASRARGAQLVNVEGERYVNELETRDAVASANIREVIGRKKGIITPVGMQGVWLDTPLIDMRRGKGFIQKYYQHLYHRFKEYDIDFSKEPVLIYPSQHYQNGGLLTDEWGETNIPCLYAVGEVAGGVHGRNRLGGNSLTDIFVFGRRAGIRAGQRAKEIDPGKLTLDHVRAYHAELAKAGINHGRQSPILLPDYRNEKALPRFQQ
jgi:succinate dehydrogenase / fumarate reductase flavoprotein subunit